MQIAITDSRLRVGEGLKPRGDTHVQLVIDREIGGATPERTGIKFQMEDEWKIEIEWSFCALLSERGCREIEWDGM